MMKGKLMKSLFRGKGGVPRTPGGPVVNEGDEVKVESPSTRQLLTKRSKTQSFEPCDLKDEVEWDGDGEVDVTVDLGTTEMVETEVRVAT